MATAAVPRSQKFNIGQYRGLLDTVQHVKDKVDKEREEAVLREQGLKEQLADKLVKGEKVQKELSVQLRCAGRSYATILEANREIAREMEVEVDKREEQIDKLKRVIVERDKVIRVADKPWKEELAKRELKMLKLQEINADLRVKVKEESEKVPPIHVFYKQQIKEKEEAIQSVLTEVEVLKIDHEEMVAKYEAQILEIPIPFKKQILEQQKEIRSLSEQADEREAGLKREIKKGENKCVYLQKELDKIDHTPYERKIDTLQDGFNRLVKDFEIKTQLNSENVAKMREGFETVIEGLDRQLQKAEGQVERRIQPYKDEIEMHKLRYEKLEARLEEMRDNELEIREKEAAIQKDLREELKVAKEAVELYLNQMTKSKRELEKAKALEESDDGPWKRMKLMEGRLEQVTEQCATMIRHKDHELQDKTSIIKRLQQKLVVDSKRFEDLADTWDKRVQEKEKGYNKSIAELAFAEGQIVEERQRTQVQIEKVKARERDIARLKEEHNEELRVRETYRAELEVLIEELEVKVEEAYLQEEGFHKKCHKLEIELDIYRRRGEERVADLKVEMVRRDRLKEEVDVKLKEIQVQYEQSRVDWEEKERELEVYIRTRDRTILALRNELEFLNDNWEIKYARLVNLYEKLQKKYEETLGAHGIQEAFRRAMAVKEENEALHAKIHELREVIQQQKKVIRGLQLDIDQLMKETADLLSEKERGIAEMAGDYTKLENKWRDEQVLRARLLKQKDAERLALAESFQARVEQLEQIMEAMRFNDRQELLDKIKLWKKNYERVCVERDEVEDYYKDLVATKETQLQKMLVENDEERAKTEAAHEHGRVKVKEVEQHWKKKHLVAQYEKEEVEQKHRDVQEELARAVFQRDRQMLMNEIPKEDPAVAKLREKIKEQEEQMKLIEAGKQAIIDENVSLRVETENVEAKTEDVHAIYKPQLEAKDREIASMEKRHDELKEILKLEMQRAKDTCKDIEDQVKRFPEPFLEEIEEMKDKYAQMQAGMQKMQMENLFLQESNEKTKKEMEKEIKSLEKTLSLAKTLLHEVSTLDALKHLSTSDARKAEADLGLDL